MEKENNIIDFYETYHGKEELKNEGINVGIYCPGWVNTRMGGDKAPITPETSVNGMRKLIDNLSSDQSGNFYRYNGEQIAW